MPPDLHLSFRAKEGEVKRLKNVESPVQDLPHTDAEFDADMSALTALPADNTAAAKSSKSKKQQPAPKAASPAKKRASPRSKPEEKKIKVVKDSGIVLDVKVDILISYLSILLTLGRAARDIAQTSATTSLRLPNL